MLDSLRSAFASRAVKTMCRHVFEVDRVVEYDDSDRESQSTGIAPPVIERVVVVVDHTASGESTEWLSAYPLRLQTD